MKLEILTAECDHSIYGQRHEWVFTGKIDDKDIGFSYADVGNNAEYEDEVFLDIEHDEDYDLQEQLHYWSEEHAHDAKAGDVYKTHQVKKMCVNGEYTTTEWYKENK